MESAYLAQPKKADHSFLHTINPKNWSPKAIAKGAITVFVVALLALTVAVLMAKYPAASGSFITIFSILAGTSLIAFIVSCVKSRHEKKDSTLIITDTSGAVNFVKGTGAATNPFDTE